MFACIHTMLRKSIYIQKKQKFCTPTQTWHKRLNIFQPKTTSILLHIVVVHCRALLILFVCFDWHVFQSVPQKPDIFQVHSPPGMPAKRSPWNAAERHVSSFKSVFFYVFPCFSMFFLCFSNFFWDEIPMTYWVMLSMPLIVRQSEIELGCNQLTTLSGSKRNEPINCPQEYICLFQYFFGTNWNNIAVAHHDCNAL